MKTWKNKQVAVFVAEDGTVYTRGPFEIEYAPGLKNTYDFKLKDRNGEDYCTTEQMEMWGVRLDKVLKIA